MRNSFNRRWELLVFFWTVSTKEMFQTFQRFTKVPCCWWRRQTAVWTRTVVLGVFLFLCLPSTQTLSLWLCRSKQVFGNILSNKPDSLYSALTSFTSEQICCCKPDPDIISNRHSGCFSCSLIGWLSVLCKHLVRCTFSSKTEIVFHKWKSQSAVCFCKCQQKQKTRWGKCFTFRWMLSRRQILHLKLNNYGNFILF